MKQVSIQQMFDILYDGLRLPKDLSNLILDYANPYKARMNRVIKQLNFTNKFYSIYSYDDELNIKNYIFHANEGKLWGDEDYSIYDHAYIYRHFDHISMKDRKPHPTNNVHKQRQRKYYATYIIYPPRREYQQRRECKQRRKHKLRRKRKGKYYLIYDVYQPRRERKYKYYKAIMGATEILEDGSQYATYRYVVKLKTNIDDYERIIYNLHQLLRCKTDCLYDRFFEDTFEEIEEIDENEDVEEEYIVHRIDERDDERKEVD